MPFEGIYWNIYPLIATGNRVVSLIEQNILTWTYHIYTSGIPGVKILYYKYDITLAFVLTLNVPVPYKYGTHQCMEPRFYALEPHLSRTSRALPTRVPRTRAAVRRRPRNSHSHASRGSAHFHAFAGRSSAHFHAIGSRTSAHFHAIRSRRSANFDGSISHAFPRIPTQW